MKAIIFDLQGTLLENGVYPSPTKQVKFILGIRRDFHDYVPLFEKVLMTKNYSSLSEGFKAVATEFDTQVPEFVFEKLVGLWNKNKILSKMYPETIEVLEDLKKNYKLVLAANLDSFSKDIISRFSLDKYFDQTFISCDTGMLKTDKEYYDKIAESLKLSKEDLLMVGDSIDSDMKNARESGVATVLVDRRDRMEYDTKIKTLSELRGMLGDA
jgi:HAD superfamily hydrolase (TIGR01493 family)